MALTSIGFFAALLVAAQSGAAADTPVIVSPRRATSPPVVAVLPELPPRASAILPSTMVVSIERRRPSGPASKSRQTITRTATRVHMAIADGRELLFERNPVDPRRVSGFVVHHDKRTIVRYDDTELRNWMALRGWADVITLGFDTGALGALQSTTQKKSLAGWTFVRFIARDRDHPVRDVWWNADEALPSSFRIVDGAGSTTMTVIRIDRVAKDEVLRSPAVRFPKYRVVDLTDWLER